MVPAKNASAVNIFWTGGWDSTLRLINLVVFQRREVHPFYLIDTERKSFPMEIRTIKKLKEEIFARYPHTDSLILPTCYVELSDIRPHKTITESFARLVATSHLGGQYDWLARFADQYRLTDLELSIHRDDRAHFFLQDFVLLEKAGEDAYYRLRDDATNSDLHIFRYFKFPLFDLTKRDMEEQAIKSGFINIMERTWFCHSPRADGSPCGICNPCRYTRKEGLGRRVKSAPLSFVIKVFLQRRLPPSVKEMIKKTLALPRRNQ